MNRRKFLAGLLASAAMPAAVAKVATPSRLTPGDVWGIGGSSPNASLWRVSWGMDEPIFRQLGYRSELFPGEYAGFTPEWSTDLGDMRDVWGIVGRSPGMDALPDINELFDRVMVRDDTTIGGSRRPVA